MESEQNPINEGFWLLHFIFFSYHLGLSINFLYECTCVCGMWIQGKSNRKLFNQAQKSIKLKKKSKDKLRDES